jgi:hypothetical protein
MFKLFHERATVPYQHSVHEGLRFQRLPWMVHGMSTWKSTQQETNQTTPYYSASIQLSHGSHRLSPISRKSEGFKYVCGITCGKSSGTKTCPIRRKPDAILSLKKYIRDHNLKHRVRMRIIQCDGGGEFGGGHLIGFKNFATHLGIQYQVSAPQNQAQNGTRRPMSTWV